MRFPRITVLIDEARSLVVTDADPHQVAAILEKARAIDQNNPLIDCNLGLTLARAGRCDEAIPLLEYAARYLHLEWIRVCYANAAFCAMEQGKLDLGMKLLDVTMSQFDADALALGVAQIDQEEPDSLVADLPGRGIWMDESGMIEERIDSAVELVTRSVREYEKHSRMPERAAQLAKLYAKCESLKVS